MRNVHELKLLKLKLLSELYKKVVWLANQFESRTEIYSYQLVEAQYVLSEKLKVLLDFTLGFLVAYFWYLILITTVIFTFILI